MSDHSLIFAYLLDGNGGGTHVDWPEIRGWKPDDGLLWMHLDVTHPTAIDWLQNESSLEEETIEVLTADETRPRCSIEDEDCVAVLRGINQNPGADPEDMVAIRLIASATRVISCRRRRVYSVIDLRERLDRGVGPRATGEILTQLSDLLVNRMASVIEELEDEVDKLEDQVSMGDTNVLRTSLAELTRTIIRMRRHISPQRDALSRLAASSLPWLGKKMRASLREDIDHVTRYIEDLDATRERAQVSQQELAQRLTDQTERRMYLLSIISAIFLPLGFITGLLGVNVGGIPYAEDASGFLLLSAALGAVSLVLLALLRWRRWF